MKFNKKLPVLLTAVSLLSATTYLAAQEDIDGLSTPVTDENTELSPEQLLQNMAALNEDKSRIEADSNDIILIIAELETQIEASKQEQVTLENQLSRAQRLLVYKGQEIEEVEQQITKLDELINPVSFIVVDSSEYEERQSREVSALEVLENSWSHSQTTPENTTVEQQPKTAYSTAEEESLRNNDIEEASPQEEIVLATSASEEIYEPEQFEEILFQPDKIVPATTPQKSTADEPPLQTNSVSNASLAAPVEEKQSVIQRIKQSLSKTLLLEQKEMETYLKNWQWLFAQPANNYTLLHGTYESIESMENSVELNTLANYEIFPKGLGSQNGQSLLLSKSATEQQVSNFKDSYRVLKSSEIINLGELQQQQCELFESSNAAIDEIQNYCGR